MVDRISLWHLIWIGILSQQPTYCIPNLPVCRKGLSNSELCLKILSATVKEIDVEVPDQMTAGAQYSLLCRTKGSYPAVKLEFWKAYKRLGARYQTVIIKALLSTHSVCPWGLQLFQPSNGYKPNSFTHISIWLAFEIWVLGFIEFAN